MNKKQCMMEKLLNLLTDDELVELKDKVLKKAKKTGYEKPSNGEIECFTEYL